MCNDFSGQLSVERNVLSSRIIFWSCLRFTYFLGGYSKTVFVLYHSNPVLAAALIVRVDTPASPALSIQCPFRRTLLYLRLLSRT